VIILGNFIPISRYRPVRVCTEYVLVEPCRGLSTQISHQVLKTYRLELEPKTKMIELVVSVQFHSNDILQAVDAISIQFLM
jgi:hypothetical protein